MISSATKYCMGARSPRTALNRRMFVAGTAALTAGFATEVFRPRPALAALPDKVDLRKYTDATHSDINYISPVKDQRSCNSCTAFGVVATIEGTYNRRYHNAGGHEGINLSEAQLFFAAGPKEKCATTQWWPEDALSYCARIGLAQDDKWLLRGGELIRISSATKLLRHNVEQTKAAMKRWILETGPVVAVMLQHSDFFRYDLGEDQLYRPNPMAFIVGGHVVSIVGYDDTPPAQDRYWICKNSYGEIWNRTGYVRIPQGENLAFPGSFLDRIDVWGVSFPS